MKKAVFPWLVLSVAVGFLVFVNRVQAAVLYAAPVTINWDPASDTTIRGYAIYYGLINQPATNRIDTGMSASATIFNLLADVTYRLYAVSYNSLGVESVPSNQVLVKQGAIAGLKIARQANGSMKLTFSAAPGTASRVQYATNLTNARWQTLGTTTNDAVGKGTMIDATAKQPSRFYRIAVP